MKTIVSFTQPSPRLRRAALLFGGLTGLAMMTSAGALAQTLVTSSSSNRLEIFNANRASGSYGNLLSSVGYAYDLGIALGDNGTIYSSGPTGLANESIDSLSPIGQIKTLVNATIPWGRAKTSILRWYSVRHGLLSWNLQRGSHDRSIDEQQCIRQYLCKQPQFDFQLRICDQKQRGLCFWQ